MDVEREVSAANRRIQRLIDLRADEALRRLGFDPDAERAEAARLERERQAAAWRQVGEEWSRALESLAMAAHEALAPLAAFAEGLRGRR